MRISKLLSPAIHDLCRFLSRHRDWAVMSESGYGCSKSFVDNVIKAVAITGEKPETLDRVTKDLFGESLSLETLLTAYVVVTTQSLDPIQWLGVFMGAEMFREGLKIIEPNGEQCEALANVRINMTLGEYEQPYPLTVVTLPESFRAEMEETYEIPCPTYVACYHHRESRGIYLITFEPKSYKQQITEDLIPHHFAKLFEPKPEAVIEDQLEDTDEVVGYLSLNDKESALVARISRVAMNINLMMTYLGVREIENHDLERLKRQAQGSPKSAAKRKKIRQAREQLEEEKLTQYIAFDQQIEFATREEDKEPSQDQGGTHASPRPHWRKGHFRMQPFGPQNSQRKRIYIKPVMVRGDRYIGDMSDASTTYSQPEE